MANLSPAGYITDASGNVLNAYAGVTADFYSAAMKFGGDWVGIAVIQTNASGSSMTLDCKIEASPNGGTNWIPFVADNNTGTQAAMTQIVGDDNTDQDMEFWLNPFPDLAGWTWRVFFDYGGTIGTNTVTAYQFQRQTAEGTV